MPTWSSVAARACVALFLVLAMAGCGTADEPSTAPTASPTERRAEETAAPPSEPSGTPSDAPLYSCFSAPYPESAWAGTDPLTDLEHPALDALRGELPEGRLEGWFVLEAGEERLVVAREREEAREPGDDTLRTHDIVSVEDVEGAWRLGQWSSCAPQLVLDDLNAAEVWLDGEQDPTAAHVELLLMELACASGSSAEGRTRLVSLVEGVDEVRLVAGVEPPPGHGQECPGNPATPMTVELTDPLGDRQIIDASIYPPRPLDVAPPDLHRG